MRIIAGRHKGTGLASVGQGDKAAHLRPTTDRVRENLFNLLQGGAYGDPITDARVLDLFAGTGALGLEALSRGASHVTFVDDGRVAGRLIRANIAKLGREADCQLLTRNVLRLNQSIGAAYDLIFLDPPYGKGLATQSLTHLHAGGWIAPEAVIVVEESGPQDAPAPFYLLDQRRYGDTHITIMEAP